MKFAIMFENAVRWGNTDPHDLVANLVYCAKPSDVETVMVDGRIVVRQGALANGDFGAIRREVERRLGVLQRRGE